MKKTILAADRTVVQSRGERRIADWLSARDIEYRYDDKFQIIQGYAIRPDFYLPGYDVYIEYWGMEGKPEYEARKQFKRDLYSKHDFNLVEITNADIEHIDDVLPPKLLRFGVSLS